MGRVVRSSFIPTISLGGGRRPGPEECSLYTVDEGGGGIDRLVSGKLYGPLPSECLLLTVVQLVSLLNKYMS